MQTALRAEGRGAPSARTVFLTSEPALIRDITTEQFGTERSSSSTAPQIGDFCWH